MCRFSDYLPRKLANSERFMWIFFKKSSGWLSVGALSIDLDIAQMFIGIYFDKTKIIHAAKNII